MPVVACPTCERDRWLSTRTIQNGGSTRSCGRCRNRQRGSGRDYRQWWLDRYTPQQIQEMAAGLTLLVAPDHSAFARPPRRRKIEEAT